MVLQLLALKMKMKMKFKKKKKKKKKVMMMMMMMMMRVADIFRYILTPSTDSVLGVIHVPKILTLR